MNVKLPLSIVAFLSLLAVGCASLRPTDPYRPVTGGAAAYASARRSPERPPGKVPEGPLELDRAIETALANNPEVAAAEWDSEAARARQDQASAERLPRIAAVGGYAHHLDEQRLLPVRQQGDPTVLTRDILSGDLVLTLPLFTGGRLVSRMRASELLREAADHRLARSREEIVFNVSSVFFSLLAQEYVIASLDFSRGTLEEHLKRVDALIIAQKAARVDRMRTEVRLADVEQRLVQEKNVMAIQRRILANLLGLDDPLGRISLAGNLEPVQHAEVPDLQEALAAAWSERDDYLAAEAAHQAQARNVDSARAEYWPSLSLLGAYGYRWGVGPTSGSGENPGDLGRVGPSVDVPLFEGGRVSARIREERANLSAAQERLRKLGLQIRLEVETALLSVRSSEERAEAIRKAIEQARESLRIERRKYDLGKGAIVDVLDAQAALLESETTYYRILAELHTALAQLQLAMGKER